MGCRSPVPVQIVAQILSSASDRMEGRLSGVRRRACVNVAVGTIMPADFTVVAIVAAYNEADIVEQVVSDLIDQGIQVYFIDDGSSDGTATLIEPFVGRGVLAVERRTRQASAEGAELFNWEAILARKAQIASELDADWFIHHDADEFREGPWPGMSFKESVRQVEHFGYNAIDFACLNFCPVHRTPDAGSDVRQTLRYYEPAAPHDRLQIRCWKRREAPVDLVSTGGHEAVFPDRRVFPIRFLLRHYPIRSQSHGDRKVFIERRPRFRADERARGWHVQYDGLLEGQQFVRDPSELVAYDGDAVRLSLLLRHRQVEELEQSLERLQSNLDNVATRLARWGIDAHGDGAGVRDALSRYAAQFEASQQLLIETSAALEKARAEIDATSSALEARNHSVDALQRRVDTLGHDARHLSDTLQSQNAELVALRRELAESRRRIDELHRSWSWRATAWARALYRTVAGR